MSYDSTLSQHLEKMFTKLINMVSCPDACRLLWGSFSSFFFQLLLLTLQKKVVEQLRKELLVKQEPEAKLQLHVQTPPVGGELKPANLLQGQQIPGGLQQVGAHAYAHRHTRTVPSPLSVFVLVT